MKLTKEHIGQKFRKQKWNDKDLYLKLIGFKDDGKCVGEWVGINTECDNIGLQHNDETWIPYEEPKLEMRRYDFYSDTDSHSLLTRLNIELDNIYSILNELRNR